MEVIMKKTALVVLICCLLVCLMGCSTPDNGEKTPEQTTAAPTLESSNVPETPIVTLPPESSGTSDTLHPESSDTPETTSAVLPPESSSTSIPESTPSVTEPESSNVEASETDPVGKNHPETTGTELFAEDSELVKALMKYLDELLWDFELPETSVAIKIDGIKNGEQPLHVEYKPSDCYFVCAYYDGDDGDATDYARKNDYTWIKFEGANEIKEYYSGEKFVVAFQINSPSLVADIRNGAEIVPNVEHFKVYEPEFDGGMNTKAHDEFERTFIYLNSSDKSDVYVSESNAYHELYVLPCVYLDGQYYITVYLNTIAVGGEQSSADLKWELGGYYDTLMEIMVTEKYSVTDNRGTTHFYGLLELGEFSRTVLE